MSDQPPETLTVANAVLSACGVMAAVLIRISGDPRKHSWPAVLTDIAGTLGLFYLCFLALLGFGFHVFVAVSAAGFAAAAGWATVFALLRRYAGKIGPG